MIREIGEEFNFLISLQKTKFGAVEFTVTTAPADDLLNVTTIGSGMDETITPIADEDKKTLKVVSGKRGSRHITFDVDNSDVVVGDVVDFENGSFGYICEIVDNKATMKTRLTKALEADKEYKQAGNTGIYTSSNISFDTDGDFMITAENHQYGILVQERVKVVSTVDSEEDSEVVAVAH